MPPDRSPAPRALRTLVTLAIVAFGTISNGQEEAIVLHPPERPAFLIDERQFNLFAFGNTRSADTLRQDLNAQAKARVNEIEHDCHLSPEQVEALRFAARGDIERFFNLIDQKRDDLIGKSVEQEKLNEIVQELQVLRQTYQTGLFAGDALLEKVAATMLDSEQSARREEAIRERNAFRYQANVDLFLTKMRTMLGLTTAQYEQLSEVMRKRPLLPSRSSPSSSPYDQYLVFYHLSTLPEDDLRPIFDDTQWQVLQPFIAQYARLGPTLKAQGLIDQDEGELK